MNALPRLAAVICVLTLLATAATAVAESRSNDVETWPLFGINSWRVLDTDSALDPLRGTAISTYRVPFHWATAEPEAGAPYDFTTHDNLVAVAARAHVQLLPVLFDSPPWVTGGRVGTGEPPERGYELARFELFAAALARRFGPRGSFWREHPELPYLPLRAWEVWNEPNFRSFWFAGRPPRASDYRPLLAAARRGLRQGDRRARIILGGLAYGHSAVEPTRYLHSLLRQRGARCLFDDVAIHPYESSPAQALRAVHRMRELLDRAGRGDAGLWLTEYGWTTGGDVRNRFHVSEVGQRRNLLRLTRALLHERRRLRLRGLYWFALRDEASKPGKEKWWGWDTGLLRLDGTPKPAFGAYRRVAQRAPHASVAGPRACSA